MAKKRILSRYYFNEEGMVEATPEMVAQKEAEKKAAAEAQDAANAAIAAIAAKAAAEQAEHIAKVKALAELDAELEELRVKAKNMEAAVAADPFKLLEKKKSQTLKTRVLGLDKKMPAKTKEPDKTVIAGSGGQIAERLPPQSIKQLEQCRDLHAAGKSDLEISKEMDKPMDWVKGSILIMTKLPAKVHEAIANRLFSRTAALQLLLAPQDKLEAIIDGAIKIAETEGKL